MLNAFFQNLTIPVLVIVSIMAYMGLSEILLNYINEKRYITTGIIALLATAIFGLKFAVIEAIIVLVRILYHRKKSREP